MVHYRKVHTVTPQNYVEGEIEGWVFQHVAKNIYKIYPARSPHSITMTGADVTTALRIPFPHRLIRLHWRHTDSAYAASTDALAIILRRPEGSMTPEHFEEDVFNETNIVKSKGTEKYGEGFEYEAGVYSVILNTTNTDLIFPILYVQKLES
jgi:hypothetical protein